MKAREPNRESPICDTKFNFKGNKMKKLTLLIALIFATSAMATEREDEGGSNQSQTANGGNASSSGNSVSFNDERNPVSSAIAPNVNVGVNCPMITVGGHAAQFAFFGGSTTGNPTLVPLCVAYHLKQFDVVQQIICNASAEYRKAAEQTGTICKP